MITLIINANDSLKLIESAIGVGEKYQYIETEIRKLAMNKLSSAGKFSPERSE